MPPPTESIIIQATPEQTWPVISDLRRLPAWYVPAQNITVLTEGAIGPGWQFVLAVKTLPGIVLDALGTVKVFDPQAGRIIWRGQAMGIRGDSTWHIEPTAQGYAKLTHTFAGTGWLYFLSVRTGRNQLIMQQRLTNLKRLVEHGAQADS